MLEALIFDFDGVVIDSEPIHLDCFRRVLGRHFGVQITDREYYEQYVAYADAECFERMAEEHGIALPAGQVPRLVAEKSALVQQVLRQSARALPGVVELMGAAAAAGVPLAVCSSAARPEIEIPLRALKLHDRVQVIVSAEDVPRGKPDPACYALTRRRLAERAGRELPPRGCVAIEDSPGGIAAARGAGLTVVAVTNTLPADQLGAAHRVVDSLTRIDLAALAALIDGQA